MKHATALATLGLALTIASPAVSAQDKVDRRILSIQEPKRPSYRELDARKAKPPRRHAIGS